MSVTTLCQICEAAATNSQCDQRGTLVYPNHYVDEYGLQFRSTDIGLRMTTHEFGFEELDKAVELMETKEENIIKPLIDFD